MKQNSYDEFQRKRKSQLDRNQSNVTRRSFIRTKHSLSDLDNEPEFVFSRGLVATKYNIPCDVSQLPLQQTQGDCEASQPLPKLPPIKRKSTLSTDMETGDFLPHEVDMPLPKSGSSSLSSRSTSSVCREYLLPIIYENLESDREKRESIIKSRWGRGTTLDIGLWDDSNARVIKIRTKEDIELDVTETNNVLSDEMVGACSSFLSKSPEIGLYVENKCELVRMNLRDISVLYHHHYLQYIDLTNNDISDLTPLGGIPYLIYLNAAQNKLRNVLRFKPPWYLTHVNLARNKISKIDDLSEFWSIFRLDLSHNAIESIRGLQNLRHMRYLNLGYNLIECIENLDNLNIQELNLEYNCITEFKSATHKLGISTLPDLRTLILRHNKLSTLGFFEGAYGLRYIDLRYNKIVDLLEVSHLKSLVYEVDFRGNPCTKWPSYRDVLLFSMPSVMFVDGASVSIPEKVSASTLFAPPLELTAARSATKLMLLEHLNAPDIDLHITPIDQSTPPLIILSGPPAVKKSILARQIADGLPERVRFCASHTTRDAGNGNSGKLSYHFVSREEFNEMTRRGEFLSTEELLGNSYGFHVSEIAALALERKIGITHMDLHAALQMQGRYVNAKLILVLTKSVEIHRQWIQEKFEVFTWVKSSEQNLVTLKVRKHHRPTVEMKESMDSKILFIDQILNQVIKTLELPLSNINVKPQEMEAALTELTINSPTTLPVMTKTVSETEMTKKHISFRREENEFTSAPSSIVTIASEEPATPTPVGLKIILDEHSNIIVENEEEKRKRQKAKVLLHHESLHIEMEDGKFFEVEGFEESVSSEELVVSKPYSLRINSSKVSEELYSKLVVKSRELYLQQHLDNLGCFSLVVFTDEFVSAYNQVIDFIYEFYVCQPLRKATFSTETQKLMQTIVESKTGTFLKELKEDVSTSKKQRSLNLRSYGLTSWNQALPSQLWQNAAEIVTGVAAKCTKES